MQGPPISISTKTVVDLSPNKSICVPIYIISSTHRTYISTQALLDSGAQINCIDYDLYKEITLPLIDFLNQSQSKMLINLLIKGEISNSFALYSSQ